MTIFTIPSTASKTTFRLRDIDVRSWRPDDIEGVNTLHNHPEFGSVAKFPGHTARTAAEWKWEFASHRPQTPPYIIAAHGPRIVGMQGYIPLEFLRDGKLLATGKNEDILIHPDYRGVGLLDEMYRLLFHRAALDGVAFLWIFTNTAARAVMRNGFVSLGKFEAMRTRLIDGPTCGAPGRTTSAHLRAVGHPSQDCGSGVDCGTGVSPAFSPPRQRCHNDSKVVIKPLVHPDERCDRFSFEFGRHIGGITIHLSARFLRWRLYDNPYRQYKVFAAFEDDRIIGLSAFKMEDHEAVGYVSELAALPGKRRDVHAVLDGLLEPGLDLFRARGYRLAEARPSGGHPYNKLVRSVLARHGFADAPRHQAMDIFVRPIAVSDQQILDRDQWRFCEMMREY